MNAVDDTGPLADPLAKVRRLVDTAAKQGLLLRALGGVAVYLLAPDGKPRIPRRVKDIDVAVPRGSGRPAARMLQQTDYVGDDMFYALHGRRLLFFDPHHERQLDVFVGESSMCHEIPLTARAEPKTMKWRPRGQVGDKVRWYQQPEEEQGPRTGTRP